MPMIVVGAHCVTSKTTRHKKTADFCVSDNVEVVYFFFKRGLYFLEKDNKFRQQQCVCVFIQIGFLLFSWDKI